MGSRKIRLVSYLKNYQRESYRLFICRVAFYLSVLGGKMFMNSVDDVIILVDVKYVLR